MNVQTYLTKPCSWICFFTLSPSLSASPSSSTKVKKDIEQCRDYSRLGRPSKQIHGLLDWIMDQEKKIALKDIRGTIGKIWMQAAY